MNLNLWESRGTPPNAFPPMGTLKIRMIPRNLQTGPTFHSIFDGMNIH